MWKNVEFNSAMSWDKATDKRKAIEYLLRDKNWWKYFYNGYAPEQWEEHLRNLYLEEGYEEGEFEENLENDIMPGCSFYLEAKPEYEDAADSYMLLYVIDGKLSTFAGYGPVAVSRRQVLDTIFKAGDGDYSDEERDKNLNNDIVRIMSWIDSNDQGRRKSLATGDSQRLAALASAWVDGVEAQGQDPAAAGLAVLSDCEATQYSSISFKNASRLSEFLEMLYAQRPHTVRKIVDRLLEDLEVWGVDV